ncbi:unannotated protein [freshwater metagenome]|uniref:Unannotated protein n=1 Tax=freshwater metagenome TaxID=449393 RepID=A0A6J6BGT0_9ZZZZ|nr:hypothetical protein [Actinomycetota bacterium]
MNDDLNTIDPNSPEYIDGLASLCLDAGITLDQVPQEFRSAVQKRMSQFAEQRRRLQSSAVVVDQATINTAVEAVFSRSHGQVVGPRRRRFVVYIGSLAAAAACVAIVGAAINQNSPSEQADQFSSKISLASDSPAGDNAVPESTAPMAEGTAPEGAGVDTKADPSSFKVISNEGELQTLLDEWLAPDALPPTVMDALCVDDLRPAVAVGSPISIFADQPAEIHFDVTQGIAVYRLSDCTLLAKIVP